MWVDKLNLNFFLTYPKNKRKVNQLRYETYEYSLLFRPRG